MLRKFLLSFSIFEEETFLQKPAENRQFLTVQLIRMVLSLYALGNNISGTIARNFLVNIGITDTLIKT